MAFPRTRLASAPLWRATGPTLIALLVTTLSLPAWSQGRPIEARVSTPTATIVLDTSGGMEFVPCPGGVDPLDPELCPTAGPPVCACMNWPPEFDAECQDFWDAAGHPSQGTSRLLPDPGAVADAAFRQHMTRHHIAMEAIAGTMASFFCVWDYRDGDPRGPLGTPRVDVIDPLRPQGIPHARACSLDEDPAITPNVWLASRPGTTETDFWDWHCGDGRDRSTGAALEFGGNRAPGVRFGTDGLVQQNRELVHFGLATLDSFRENDFATGATDPARGMWSYACGGAGGEEAVWPRDGASPADVALELRTCLGIRGPDAAEGALVVPDVLSGAAALGTLQVERIQSSLRTLVPYWATPIAAALHDVRHMLVFEPEMVDDLEATCRPHNVILLSDSVPTYNRRFGEEQDLTNVCEQFPTLEGCENYWYPNLFEVADDLFRNTVPGAGTLSFTTPEALRVNLFNIAFALNAEEAAISERELLSSFSTVSEELGDPFLIDADDLEQLRTALSLVLSSVLEGHLVSRTAPAVTTLTRGFSAGRDDTFQVPMSRFEAFTRITETSPFWGGTVNRSDWICDYSEEDGFTLLAPEDQVEPVAWSAAEKLEEFIQEEGLMERRILTNGLVERCVTPEPLSSAGASPLVPPAEGPMGFYLPSRFTDDPFGISLTVGDLTRACDLGAFANGACDLTGVGGTRFLPAFDDANFDPSTCMLELDEDTLLVASGSGTAEICTVRAMGVVREDLPSIPGTGLIDCTVPDIGEPDEWGAGQLFLRQLLRFVRGATISEILAEWPDDPPPYPSNLEEWSAATGDRPSRFGAVMYSSPLIVPPPSVVLPFEGLQDPDEGLLNEELEGFGDPEDDPVLVRDRPTMLYIGSDAGVLHAINAATGDELWAFYPSTLLRSARRQIRARQPMVDGTPVARELRVFRGNVADEDDNPRLVDRWRTVLIFGLRQGGRGYVALDITNPIQPRFLWQYDQTNDPAMGHTYGKAALATVRLADCSHFPSADGESEGLPDFMKEEPLEGPCERGVAILPGGVNPGGLQADPTSGVGRVLVVVDVLTGMVIQRFTAVGLRPDQTAQVCNPTYNRCFSIFQGAPNTPCHPDPANDLGIGDCVRESFECPDSGPAAYSTDVIVTDPGVCVAETITSLELCDPLFGQGTFEGQGRCMTESEYNSGSSCDMLLALGFITGSGMSGECGDDVCRPTMEARSQSCMINVMPGRCVDDSFSEIPTGCATSADCPGTSQTVYTPGLCVPEETCVVDADCNEPMDVLEMPASLSGSVIAFDTFAGNLATRAFVGDEQGRLLRLDMSSPEPLDWSIDIFFDPIAAGEEDFPELAGLQFEPVLFEPTIAYLGNLDRAVVIYGLGDLNRLETGGELDETNVNHVFSLTERPRFSAEDGRLIRDFAEVNWILRLNGEPLFDDEDNEIGRSLGERLTTRPRIFNRVAYFATYMPNPEDPCAVGNARLYAVHYAGPQDDEEEYTRYVALTADEEEEPEEGVEPELLAVLPRLPAEACRDDAEQPFLFYCDADEEEDALVQPRSVINALDFVQPPSCFIRPDLGEEMSDSASIPPADGQAGGFQLLISQSAASPADADDRSARASTRLVDNVLQQPDGPALPTSWGIITPW